MGGGSSVCPHSPAVYLELELNNCLRSKWIPTPISQGSQARPLAPCSGTLRIEHLPNTRALMTVGVSNSRPLSTVACELCGTRCRDWEQVTDPPGASFSPTWTTRSKRKSLWLCGLRAAAAGVTGRTAFTGLLISRPVYESTHTLRGCFRLGTRRGGRLDKNSFFTRANPPSRRLKAFQAG